MDDWIDYHLPLQADVIPPSFLQYEGPVEAYESTLPADLGTISRQAPGLNPDILFLSNIIDPGHVPSSSGYREWHTDGL